MSVYVLDDAIQLLQYLQAGGLQGQRGDVLFPTHFIHERGDIPDFRSVDNRDVDVLELQQLSHRCVHVGPMVTIPGTLLQNRRALRLYHTIWASVGLEMEGVYFVQALNKATVMGIVHPTVQSRFLYYISDLPLSAGASLAKPMSLEELIPPLYAITRIFLLKCLQNNRNPSGDVNDSLATHLETARLSEDDELTNEIRSNVSTSRKNSYASSDGDGAGGGYGNKANNSKHHLKHFQNVCRAVARFKLAASSSVASDDGKSTELT